MRVVLSLMLVSLGCGGDPVRHVADAAVNPDSRVVPDASPDAGPQPVTLTITNNGSPMAGITVHFQNADSSVVSSTTTDASGVASAVMVAGGYVTALDPFVLPFTAGLVTPVLDTFAGVKPGDHLVLKRTNSTGITINVIAPADVNPAASNYWLATSCSLTPFGDVLSPPINGSSSTATGAVSLYNCNGTADVLLVTTDINGVPVRYIYKPATTVTNSMTLDLTPDAYVSTTQRDYTWNNVVEAEGPINFNDFLLTSSGPVYGYTGRTSGNPALATVNMPAFAGALDLVHTSQQPSLISLRDLYQWDAYAATYTTDFGAHVMPDFTAPPSLDPATHVVSWTESTTALQPDLVFASVFVSRASDNHTWRWRITAPHTNASFQFPALPTTGYDFNMVTGDSVSYDQLDLAKVPGGYDSVRAGLLSSNGPTDFVAGASGFISVSSLLQQILRPADHAPLVQPLGNRR
jgi:hypothetical protein